MYVCTTSVRVCMYEQVCVYVCMYVQYSVYRCWFTLAAYEGPARATVMARAHNQNVSLRTKVNINLHYPSLSLSVSR